MVTGIEDSENEGDCRKKYTGGLLRLMNYYTEEKQKLPIKREVEVLVIGSGPAGFSAAVNAARQGAETMLIEQLGCVGGMATEGLMSHWTGKTEGGFYEEILDRSADGENRKLINPEKLKTVMMEMLDEEGVLLQLYTIACKPVMKNNRVQGVITESKSGREVIKADILIDASGDGDIAARSGVPYHKGRKENGKMQPATLMFKLGGVDTERAIFIGSFEESVELPEGDLQTLAEKHLPDPAGHFLVYQSTLPGVVTCNMTNAINVDGTEPEDLTSAVYECRKQLRPIVNFLQEFVPGYENCYLLDSGSLIGIRETRHFEGEYVLSREDILRGRVFEDWVVPRVHFNFDVHNLSGSGLDETGVQKEFPQDKGYTIPYRSFIPKKIEGLFLAGRNISGTHMAHSNFRVMPICANMGQAVGNAAAICVKKDILPRNLDVNELQNKLKEQGVKI